MKQQYNQLVAAEEHWNFSLLASHGVTIKSWLLFMQWIHVGKPGKDADKRICMLDVAGALL